MEALQSFQKEKKSNSFFKWLKGRKGQQTTVIIVFMFAPMFLLFLFTYLPFAEMFRFSFYKMKYIGEKEFVGLNNYVQVFARDDCFGALKLSFYYMGGSIVQLIIALYLATILSFKTRFGSFFKGAMFFPFLISGIAIGFIFKFFYTRGFVLDTILQAFGFDLENLPYWLKNQSINNISLVATSVWRYFGQNMVLFIGAIMSVDGEMYEAAQLDGANKWQQFKYIILPSIKTVITLNMILSISGSLSAFDPPFVITKGGNGTATYFVIMSEIAHVTQKVGLAAAMAIVLFIIIIILTILQKLFFRYVFSDGTEDNGKKRKEIKTVKTREGH